MKPLDPKPCSVTQFDVICHPAQTHPDKGINLSNPNGGGWLTYPNRGSRSMVQVLKLVA